MQPDQPVSHAYRFTSIKGTLWYEGVWICGQGFTFLKPKESTNAFCVSGGITDAWPEHLPPFIYYMFWRDHMIGSNFHFF